MSFQSSVSIRQGFGVPGEIFQDAPWVVLSYTLESDGTPNVIGSTAYTITSDGVAEAGAGGAFGFAGILSVPKSYALFGVGSAPLAPTLVLPDSTQAELLTMGIMIVTLPAAANIGDYVLFDNVTGSLSTMAPSAVLPVGTSFANAVVSQYTQVNVGSGLAVIQVIPVINPIPVTGP
jgi:hypothetical protein